MSEDSLNLNSYQMSFEHKCITLAIEKCIKNPTYKNFSLILAQVKPEMMRGSVNEDNYGKHSLIFSAYCDLAMVIAGYKPLCIIGEKYFHSWLECYNVCIIPIKGKIIIWTQDDQYQNAREFAKYLKDKSLCDPHQTSQHHHIIGKYLGIPTADTDYYIQHLIKRHQDAINKLQ